MSYAKYQVLGEDGIWRDARNPDFKNKTAYTKADKTDNWFGWCWLTYDEIEEVKEGLFG
jgi:hypothetical protein